MKITLLGTGTPRPSLQRSGPATVVHTETAGLWLVDCGDGTITQLLRAGIPAADVRRLVFTHLHEDHTAGLLHFLFGGWNLGRRELSVYGPTGTRRLVQTLLDLYAEDLAYRLSMGRPSAGLTDIAVHEIATGTVCREADLTVDALPVDHSIETYALRFREGDQTVVHSGDTRYCEALIPFAAGADILVHEAHLVPALERSFTRADDAGMLQGLRKTHATPREAARIARQAGVRKLVLVHLPPPTDPVVVRSECEQEYTGEIIVGEDLLSLSI